VAQKFAHAVAELLASRHPDAVVADMSKALRAGKVFIDWSQNIQTKTTVGVYSLRAKHPLPFVSIPVSWSELTDAIGARDPKALFFSPAAGLDRIKQNGDLFSPVLRIKQRLPKDFIQTLGAASTPGAG